MNIPPMHSFTPYQKLLVLIVTTLLFYSTTTTAQSIMVKGRVINYFTNEPIAFGSVRWKIAGNGVVTDSTGRFSVRKNNLLPDTLVVSYIGFEDVYRGYNAKKDTGEILITLPELKLSAGVEVKTKFNKGLRWWKAVMAHKKENDPFRHNNYSYELYNKMELDINNIKRSDFESVKMLRPFAFVLENIDSTSEAKPFLPFFLTETISDYYYSNTSNKTREDIKAVQTTGIKNETVLQFLGGVNQRVNCYENTITVFGKELISPFSSYADKYYNFKGTDTQTINQEKYFHLYFSPKREGTNTFKGDCWIHSGSWGIQKINLDVAADAAINFVHRLVIIQEFARQNNQWVFVKDKFIADLSPFKKQKLSFIGRKTTTYKNVHFNDPAIEAKLATNKSKDEVNVSQNAQQFSRQFWDTSRHEQLSLNENKVYVMIDTLQKMPVFKKYSEAFMFVFDGHKKYGAVEIGPWYKWLSGNQLEKVRLRFDLGTTPQFSNHLRLYGYLAYGFQDARWKGKFGFNYKFNHHETWNIFGHTLDDLDNGRIKYNDNTDATTDNLFSQVIRRQNIRQKFLGLQETKLGIGKQLNNEWSAQVSFANTQYSTYAPLPSQTTFTRNGEDKVITSEAEFRLRFAPGEKQITTNRKTIRLRTNSPVIELKYASAFSGFIRSDYNYQRVNLFINQHIHSARLGQFDYMIYGGKYWGDSIPFMLLEVHPGNEIYYYNKQSFNLMNRFEFVSDHFLGVNIEHNFEKKLFNLLPFMRKTKMRQFWNVKTVWGDLTTANRAFNRLEFSGYRLRRLREEFYTEVGTGIDNIFKFFRIDLVWRFAPTLVVPPTSTVPNNEENFAVFGSFRLQF